MEKHIITWEIVNKTVLGDWFLPVVIIAPIAAIAITVACLSELYFMRLWKKVLICVFVGAVVAVAVFGINALPFHKGRTTTEVSPVVQLENVRTIDGKLRASSEEIDKRGVEVHPASSLIQKHKRGENLEGVLMCRQDKCLWVTEDEAEKKEYAQSVLDSKIIRLIESYR